MIEIEGPDGVIYEFPEGTDEAEMLSAMDQVYGSQPQQSPAMEAGLAELSSMSQGNAPEQSLGEWLYGNIIGNPNDGVVNAGESLGPVLDDTAKALSAGMSRGATSMLGLPGTVGDAFNYGMTGVGKELGLIPEEWSSPQSSLSGQALTQGLGDITGGATDYRGEGDAARYAGTVGEFIPGAMALGGTSLANLLINGVAPGVASEGAGQLTEGTKYEPYARVAAAMLAPMAAQGVANIGGKIISPNAGADPERLALAKILDDAGVPVSAGQRVGNEALRRKEGLTARGQDLVGEQAEAFTEAALKTAGINAKRATPEVMAKAADDIGQVFDDVVRGVDVIPDVAHAQRAEEAINMARELSPDKLPPLLANVNQRLLDSATGGVAIPASTLKQWRSNLSKLTRSPEAATREGAVAMMEVVDDAMASTLNNMGRAKDVERLAQARADYRNFLALEKAVAAAGENAASGLISPSSLRNAVKTQGASSYVRGGRGDIASLARAGEGVMKPLPNSGTPAGMSALGVNPQNMMAAIGGGAGASFGGPFGAVAGALAGSAAPAVAGAARMSPLIQKYLANQAIGKSTTGALSQPSQARSIIAALLAQGNQ